MCAPYGRWVVLFRERGREALRLIGFAHADGAESAYRSRIDALWSDIDVSVVPPPGYESDVGEPMVLLRMLRLDFALVKGRSLVRDTHLSRRYGSRQRRVLH
jgi:surfactin synthase thioesterase subunit